MRNIFVFVYVRGLHCPTAVALEVRWPLTPLPLPDSPAVVLLPEAEAPLPLTLLFLLRLLPFTTLVPLVLLLVLFVIVHIDNIVLWRPALTRRGA